MSNALTSKVNDCRSCYKCIRNCPTKSISFQNGQASIIPEECVLCGKCFLVCPQECKIIRDDLPLVKDLLAKNDEVIASLAPSFMAAFPGASFPTMKKALLELGFSAVEETAVGATIVKKQYDALAEDDNRDIIISTCCHSINLLIEKHYPDAAKYLADVLSPMLAHGQDLKKRHPKAKVVFLGPCISKKNEIEMYPGYVDAVLTFLELQRFFAEKGIVPAPEKNPAVVEKSLARLFPIEGGILATMKKDNPARAYVEVAGMEQSIAAIKDILAGKIHHVFIEMSSCVGSCVNGPAIPESSRSLLSSFLAVHSSAGHLDYDVADYSYAQLKKRMPGFAKVQKVYSEEEIEDVLRSIGKSSKKDELNCSSCGYPTCRDKAIAVLEGKANLEMCLPFLMERARSFSNTVVDTTFYPIVVVNEAFTIELANPAMLELVGAKSSKDLLGKSIGSYLDLSLYSLALSGTPIKDKKVYVPDYDKYLSATITYDPRFHIIIAGYRDVTSEEKKRQKDQAVALETAKITSEVIEKNMRAVQEIASLLGESTAETKVALTKLQATLAKEDKDE
jgi:iron only hydrogenase large subunit-like protein